jgi:hypothetical protein
MFRKFSAVLKCSIASSQQLANDAYFYTVNPQINRPPYIRISEITDATCWFRNFRLRWGHVQLAVLTVNYRSGRYMADTDVTVSQKSAAIFTELMLVSRQGYYYLGSWHN